MKRWVAWLLIWLGVAIGGQAAAWWLVLLGLRPVGLTLAWLSYLAGTGWLLWGLFCWRERRWVRLGAWLLVSTYAAGGAAWQLQRGAHDSAAIAVLGVWGMAVAFLLGLALLRALLSAGHPICGVARTLIDEAVSRLNAAN